MDGPPIKTLYDVLDSTWPAKTMKTVGPWVIREGAGGGQRVAATTAIAPWSDTDITLAEREMKALDQPLLFQIRDGDDSLDGALQARGYDVVDPVSIYVARPKDLAGEATQSARTFSIWPPLAVMRQIWADGGVGPSRVAVMERAKTPKTAFLARAADRAAGCAYVAIHDKIAMIHAIEVSKTLRRNGAATNILQACAKWAQDMDARWISLIVTDANSSANNLYSKLGLSVVGRYHYRRKS